MFAAGGLLWYLAVGPRLLSAWWIAAAVLGFAVLAGFHEATIRGRSRALRAVAFYERGRRRIDDEWIGHGDDGARFADPSHAYAEDLDVFGPGSLFERIDTAQTEAGKRTLAGWLSAPASADEIRRRHVAAAELRPLLDFREELALLGGEDPHGLGSARLARWAEESPPSFPGWLRGAGLALPALPIAAAAGWFASHWGPGPVFLAVAVELLAVLPWRARVRESVTDAAAPGAEARGLGRVLAAVEAQAFRSPLLAAALAPLDRAPSRELDRLARLVDLIESRRNLFFAPFAAVLLWDLHLALAVESWRRRCGFAVSGWLAALGELEALASLAAYAFERPGDPFPEISDGVHPVFRAIGLGHPLLPAAELVRNDVDVGTGGALLVVSGSNMSGKSTLLRAVGTNAVLACAGAPVCAQRLELSELAVGASIRIHDSLREGRSRFFAEIRRLRQLLDLAAGPRPLLFLLDEILHGTNSADRRQGAEAVLVALVERGAIGLVTTHDLALAEIPESLPGRARNVHFQDHVQRDGIRFDYRMRPGVVKRSNAIALMRAVGIPLQERRSDRLTTARTES